MVIEFHSNIAMDRPQLLLKNGISHHGELLCNIAQGGERIGCRNPIWVSLRQSESWLVGGWELTGPFPGNRSPHDIVLGLWILEAIRAGDAACGVSTAMTA